jgi:hypothetical protein
MKEDMLSLFVTAFMLSLVCSRIAECTFSVFVVKVPFLFCFRRIIMERKLLVHYLSLHCFFSTYCRKNFCFCTFFSCHATFHNIFLLVYTFAVSSKC